ncbi:hypothetical protein IWW48_004868 [Coemansia sp. RSA 1200]|nr:hypothetical protein IWW48_004868 [Coemansia sp. RSA 1200]
MSGSESDLLARSSRLTPTPLLPTEQHRPGHADTLSVGMQTIGVIRRYNDSHVPQVNPSEAQKGRFSIVSRRSSAPDISELAQQLGRRIESISPQLSETSGPINQALSPQGSQHSQVRMLSPRRANVDYSDTDIPNTNEQRTGPSIAYCSGEAAPHIHCDADKKNNHYNGALSGDEDSNSTCALYPRTNGCMSAINHHDATFSSSHQEDVEGEAYDEGIESLEQSTKEAEPSNTSHILASYTQKQHHQQHHPECGQEVQGDCRLESELVPRDHSEARSLSLDIQNDVDLVVTSGNSGVSSLRAPSNKAPSEASISGIYDMGTSMSPEAGLQRDLVDIHWQHSASENRRLDEMTPMTFSWKKSQGSETSIISQQSSVKASPERAAEPSPSIASAKAFLTMIAFGNTDTAGGIPPEASGLYVDTLHSRANLKHDQLECCSVSPALASAPLEYTDPILHLGDTDRSTEAGDTLAEPYLDNCSRPEQGLDSTDKDGLSSASLGVGNTRSLKSRSRLAGVGIRRASTYVWNRSSVFMRSLSSADELPVSPELKQPQQQQQYHKSQNANLWETDADTGSTKTEEHLDDSYVDKGPELHVTAADSEHTASSKSQPSLVTLAHKRSPAAMRLHAARELVMTEKNFVDNLFVIKKVG